MKNFPTRAAIICLVLVQSLQITFAEEVPQTSTMRHAEDGRAVWDYVHPTLDTSTPEAREKTYKPFHHVYSPDGSVLLTKGPGGLYPHHRGMFFGFSKITYGDGKKCDTWHCKDGAYQSHEKMMDDGKTSLIHWHGNDGEVFAHEQREIRLIHPTGSDVKGTLLEFRSRLESVGEPPLHLDGDPQHAGFQFRASQEVAESTSDQTYYLRTDGKGELGKTRNWNHTDPGDPVNAECTNRPWNAMSFVVEGKRYTALYMDHPSNPKPAHYSEREYGRFGSYFVTEVTQDKPLEVKYRLWIQEGEMTVDGCEAMAQEFISDR